MAKRVSVDRWLFVVTLLLIFAGLVMVFSASAVMAKERYGSAYFFLLRQLGWAAIGVLLMIAAMQLDYRRYKHPAVVFSCLGFTTLLLIAVFFVDRAHHTHRWIHWGPLSFQPSEMAKPALILFLAFVSLASGPETEVKVLATGLAAGILLDATVIRALLVPAVVSLFGRWNWWLPPAPARLLRVEPSPSPAGSAS